MATKVLINLFHPTFKHSRGNKVLADAVSNLPDVTFRHVDSEYDGMKLDVPKEQKLLADHQVIVIQHPVMWYSVPPMLKTWYDQVFLRGWAYPAAESKLAGKTFQLAVTTGSPSDAYRSGGINGFTVSEFLRPQQQTALLCGMNFVPIFATQGVIPVAWGGISDADLAEQAKRYAELVVRHTQSS